MRKPLASQPSDYATFAAGIRDLLDAARRASARAVNTLMTATYWEIGRRIVEFEQGGKDRAGYGKALLIKLSADLAAQFGRGFSVDNLERARKFYRAFPLGQKSATPLRIFKSPPPAAISATPLRKSRANDVPAPLIALVERFPMPWSHYTRLISLQSPNAVEFYHTEALRGGWTVKQLERQINSQFYERTALSKNKAAMLTKGAKPKPEDAVSADEELKDPCVLEFLGLKDEYSESELEEALIQHLESFLLELGGDFAFIGRQRRLRIGSEWYRVDLLFFHRGLRCLLVVDLKVGRFTPADAGQMHLYLNYAREHWTRAGENPPVGLILCAEKDDSVAKYALAGLPNKVLAREYHLALPNEQLLAAEIQKTRKALNARRR